MLFVVPERVPSSDASAKEHCDFLNLVESGEKTGDRFLKITSDPGFCDLVLIRIEQLSESTITNTVVIIKPQVTRSNSILA